MTLCTARLFRSFCTLYAISLRSFQPLPNLSRPPSSEERAATKPVSILRVRFAKPCSGPRGNPGEVNWSRGSLFTEDSRSNGAHSRTPRYNQIQGYGASFCFLFFSLRENFPPVRVPSNFHSVSFGNGHETVPPSSDLLYGVVAQIRWSVSYSFCRTKDKSRFAYFDLYANLAVLAILPAGMHARGTAGRLGSINLILELLGCVSLRYRCSFGSVGLTSPRPSNRNRF